MKYPVNYLVHIAIDAMNRGKIKPGVDDCVEKLHDEEAGNLEDGDVDGVKHDVQPDAVIATIAEHLNAYMPDECAKGKEWQTFVKWAYECQKHIAEAFPGGKSLLEYMVENLSSIDLGKLVVCPRKEPVVPRRRIAAFLRQASSSSREVARQDIMLRCCKQFQLSSTEDLDFEDDIPVTYEGHEASPIVFSMALNNGVEVAMSGNVGRLGVKALVDARKQLSTAPLLSKLHDWSQWSAVFEPQFGPLSSWLEENGACCGISALWRCDGSLIRIDPQPCPEKYLNSIIQGSSQDAAAQLVSLAALHGGTANAPLELLRSHTLKGLQVLSQLPVLGGSSERSCNLVLDCLAWTPQEFLIYVGEVMYPALSSLVSSASDLLLRACDTRHRHLLHRIGLEMGVPAWIDDFSNAGVKRVDSQDEAEPVSKRQRVESSEAHASREPVLRKEIFSRSEQLVTRSETAETARVIVEAIRREEFGFEDGGELVESDLLGKQHARMGRALQCLSHNLYAEDCHFILELIQNADDNIYDDCTSPSLAFIVRQHRITVCNNEGGFSAKDMRALCDVGNSTKAGSVGYIGHKGIGFKSVFKVTDCPEIHSNGFHVKFDITENALGFILPTLVSPPSDDAEIRKMLGGADNFSQTILNTRIELPLKQSMLEEETRSVAAMFSQLHPSLLLFLHKLRMLVVRDETSCASRILERQDIGKCLVRVTDCAVGETYLLVRQHFQPAVPRAGVSMTELCLAFCLKELPDGRYEAHPNRQQVFAFLPVRSYGLKFIVQGDFVLPSSREEVDRDSAWNQWLLSEIPRLFLQALDSFKGFFGFGARNYAITSYMSYVPLDGEVLGFFSPLPKTISSLLRATPCLPTAGEEDRWVLPCTALRGWDDSLRQLVPDGLLMEHLGLSYLSKGVILSSMISSALGLQNFRHPLLLDLMKSICNKPGTLERLGVQWVRRWLLVLDNQVTSEEQELNFISRQRKDTDLDRSSMSSVEFIPLASGGYSSLAKGPVWFLGGAESEDEHLRGFVSLYSELRTVHPHLVDDSRGESGMVRRILTRLGVKQISSHEIMKSHILPMLASNDCLEKEPSLVMQYLAYCVLHMDFHNCGSCAEDRVNIMEQLQHNSVLLTDHGLWRISNGSVHFSTNGPTRKKLSDVKKAFNGIGVIWREVSEEYLNIVPPGLRNVFSRVWRKFLLELGVTDFVRVLPQRIHVTDISSSVWKNENWGAASCSQGWLVDDWVCPELKQVFQGALPSATEDARRSVCVLILSVLDEMWDEDYEKFAQARYASTSRDASGICTSSFIYELRNFQWIESSLGGRLLRPEDLFHRGDPVERYLAQQGAYAVPQLHSSAMVTALGLRTSVTIADVMSLFPPGKALGFSTSMLRMQQVYRFMQENLAPESLKEALDGKACIFLPSGVTEKLEAVVSGKLHNKQEVAWEDPFGVLESLEATTKISGKLPLRTLAKHYPGFESFFVRGCGVFQAPSFSDYVNVLQTLARRVPPSAVLSEVSALFAAWSRKLDTSGMDHAEMSQLRSLLRRTNPRIFPSAENTWIKVFDARVLTCWSDDKELLDEFGDLKSNQDIQFVEVEGQFKKDIKTEKRRELQTLSIFRFLGILKFSEVVDREAVVDAEELTCFGKLQDVLAWSLPYAQRYMLQYHEEAYHSFVASGADKQLHGLECVVATRLFFRYAVRRKEIRSRQTIECKCLLQGRRLLVASSSTEDYASIFLELSRLFFSGERNNGLANFLHLLVLQVPMTRSEVELEAMVATSQGVAPLAKGQWRWGAAAEQQQEQDTEEGEEDSDEDGAPWPPNFWFRAQEADTGAVVGTRTGTGGRSGAGTGGRSGAGTGGRPGAGSGEAAATRDTLQSGTAPNPQRQEMTGINGERVVYQHYVQKYGEEKVTWLNQQVESGCPYDIIIDKEGGLREFVEVKATSSCSKDWFEMSPNEWDFAKKMGNSYVVARVVLREKTAQLTAFRDPVRLCLERQALKMALILVKKNEGHPKP